MLAAQEGRTLSGEDLAPHHPDSAPSITLCVGAIVLRGDKVLFVRQTYGKLTGVWSLPWGLLDGVGPDGGPEPPHQAAVRETQEEAGVTAEVEGLLGIQNHTTQDGKLALYLLYLGHHVSGEPVPDNYETDRAAYFSLDEIESLGEPFDAFCRWMAYRVLMNKHSLTPPTPANPYHPHLAFL
jgi:ADP-ribose pyrophosphatase YjhB (NUDIX family)